ncbi:MAG TPA: hypothetical protein PLP19_04880 [bacterium]|nr:hypothetical protein [bacterium]HPN42806.1 hypothetical protein [bacterium]
MLFNLLYNRLNLALYSLRNYKNNKARGILVRFIVMLIIPYWIFSTSRELFSAWHAVPGFNVMVIIHFIALLLTGIFILLIISGVPQALHFNFLAPDSILLSALPLESLVIKKYRFWEIYFSNSSVFFLFGLPVIAAALVVVKVSLPAVILLLAGLLLLLVIPTGIASLFSLLIARFLPVKRTKNFSSLIMGIMIIGLWAFMQFFRLSRLDPFSGEFDADLFNRLVQTPEMNLSRFLPPHWAARVLSGLVTDNLQQAMIPLVLLLLAAVVIYELTIRLADQIDKYAGYQTGGAVRAARQKPAEPGIPFAQVVQSRHVIRAMVERDLKLYFRDSRFVTQIFFYFSLFLVLPFLLREPFTAANETFAHYAPFTCMLFATIFMAGGLTARGIPLEKRAMNYNRLAPNTDSIYLLAKFGTGFLLTTAALFFGILILVVLEHSPAHIILQAVILLLFNTFGAAAIGLAIGVIHTNFNWDNPRQMLTDNGNIILNIAGMVYLGGGILAFVTGVKLSGTGLALIFFSIYTLVCCLLGIRLALLRVPKIEAAL